jgi:DNA-binding transcriptional regulator GbsR (MarR family)
MIKSDAQRDRTQVQIEGFRKACAKVAQETPSKRSEAIRKNYESMIRQLEDELREYEHLKSGELKLREFSASVYEVFGR